MDGLLKGISAFIPFMAPYPLWVKGVFAGWVLLSAMLLIALVIGRPAPAAVGNGAGGAEPGAADASDPPAQPGALWLVIDGVEFLGGMPGTSVRVTANVNGTEYLYPSVGGVEWLGVGPGMASQVFRLPPTDDRYVVRFEAEAQVPGAEGVMVTGRLTSVREHHVQVSEIPVEREYQLHSFDLPTRTRSPEVNALVRYRITSAPN